MKLEVRDFTCGYDPDHPVQRYLNFTVESGQVCCILGPNGCGKSTLFKSMLGLLPPLGGVVLADNSDISKWSAKKLASRIAFVPQTFDAMQFPFKVYEIVQMGRLNRIGLLGKPKGEDVLAAEEALEACGIYHLRDEIHSEISGGELQLVMIARALTQKPQLLILDEPTAALDYGNAVRVISKVRNLARDGYAVLMTTHSPDHAFMCNSQVVLLRKDELPICGQAQDVITDRNMRRAYGVNIKVVEYVNSNNEITRKCAPMFL